MNPPLRSLHLLLLLALGSAAPLHAQSGLDLGPPNILDNYSFEDGQTFWYMPNIPPAQQAATHWLIDDSPGASRTGQKALKFVNTSTANYHIVRKLVFASPGETLSVKAYVKGGITSGLGAGFFMQAFSGGTSLGAILPPVINAPSFDWTPVEMNYTVPATADRVFICLYFKRDASNVVSTGTVWFDDIEVTVTPAAPPANLLANASFDAGLTGWTVIGPGTTLETDPAKVRGGSGTSLRMFNDQVSPPTLPVVMQTFTSGFAPTNIAYLSGWVKAEGMPSIGATFYMYAYDATGKSIGSGLAPNIVHSGTGPWRFLTAALEVPANTAKLELYLAFRRRKEDGVWLAATGTAYFDDVRFHLEPWPPVRILHQSPNYRGISPAGNTTPFKCELNVRPLAGWTPGATITVKNAILDSLGAVLAGTTETTVALGSPATATAYTITRTVAEGRPTTAGDYYWRVTVTDPSGKTHLSVQPIRIAATQPANRIDADGFYVHNNARFFPIGIYLHAENHDFNSAAHLQTIKDGGFNTVLSYTHGYSGGATTAETTRLANGAAFLDLAASKGLKVFYSLRHHHTPFWNETPALLQAAVVDRLEAYAAKPALLGWYINDEFKVNWVQSVQSMSSRIRSLDPTHPTVQMFAINDHIDFFYAQSDVIGTDPYPLTGATLPPSDLLLSTERVTGTVAAARGAKSVIQALQVYNQSVLDDDAPSHQPTLAEIRNQAWQAVIGGAKGLMMYAYPHLFWREKEDTAHVYDLTQFNTRWPAVSGTATEVAGYVPAILANNLATVTNSNPEIKVRALTHGGKLLLFVANPYYASKTTTITLPAGWTQMENANQSGIQGSLSGNQLTLTFDAIESGVFALLP